MSLQCLVSEVPLPALPVTSYEVTKVERLANISVLTFHIFKKKIDKMEN